MSKIGIVDESTCFIKVFDKNGNIMAEFTSQSTQDLMDKMDVELFNLKPGKTDRTKKRKIENYKSSLMELKTLLEDRQKFQKLIMSLKNHKNNSIQGSKAWSTNVSTVTGYNLDVNGIVSD